MKLKTEFPDNLNSEMLLSCKLIPCFCKISSVFEIEFNEIMQTNVTGLVEDWDIKEIDLRSPAGGGGKYIHYNYGLVTLNKIDRDIYNIVELRFFCSSVGWNSIVVNGMYGPIGEFWDDE